MDTQDQNGNSSKSASQENEPIPFHKVAMPLLQQTGKVGFLSCVLIAFQVWIFENELLLF